MVEPALASRILQWAAAVSLMWIGLSIAGLMPALPAVGSPLTGLGGAAGNLIAPARRHPVLGPLSAGLSWGICPCPMVYGGLFAAALTGSLTGGATLMAGFGADTLPAVVASAFGLSSLARFRTRPWAHVRARPLDCRSRLFDSLFPVASERAALPVALRPCAAHRACFHLKHRPPFTRAPSPTTFISDDQAKMPRRLSVCDLNRALSVARRRRASLRNGSKHMAKTKKADAPRPTRLKDYRPPAYLIDHVDLDISLDPARTRVHVAPQRPPEPRRWQSARDRSRSMARSSSSPA